MRTEIVYVLDRSGSMVDVWSDAWGGLLSFIDEQQKLDGECRFSLVGFDDQYEMFIDGADLQAVRVNNDELFIGSRIAFGPRGMTALLDAIGKTVNDVGDRLAGTDEAERPEKVIVVIMTDGEENHSTEFTHEQVKEMIVTQERDYAWEFIYMGAGVDVFSHGISLGMKSQNLHNAPKTKAGFRDSNQYGSASTAGYRGDALKPDADPTDT